MKSAIAFFVLTGLIILFYATYSKNNNVTVFDNPPDSLAQWYKPASKRNIWQHNMFKLRRELQAITSYASENNWELTQQWAQSFDQHYRNISEMVPQWREEIDLKSSNTLILASTEKNKHKLNSTIRDLRQDCRQCHETYRGVAALRFRAPDFSELKLLDSQGKSIHYKKYMKLLMRDLNSIVIANTDHRYNKALQALSDLESGMIKLGKSCSGCHKNSPEAREYYLGAKTQSMVDKLRQSLVDKSTKEIGHNIGSLAVQACAKCHGTHRIASDMRVLLK